VSAPRQRRSRAVCNNNLATPRIFFLPDWYISFAFSCLHGAKSKNRNETINTCFRAFNNGSVPTYRRRLGPE
jgi:hypothetical protein